MCYNKCMIKFKNKKCPRCNFKVPRDVVTCPSCQLNYQKFETATNKEAKQALKQGEKSKVLYRKGCPKDVNKWGLFFLALFLGFMGAHLYRVGRNGKGAFYTVFFIVGFIYTIITNTLKLSPTGDLWQIFIVLVLVWGVVLIMWLVDVFNILFNQFKIPVSREK